MSFSPEYSTEEQYATPMEQLAHGQAMTMGYTYPDPMTLVTQAYPPFEDTLPDALSSYNPCLQPWESHTAKGLIETVSRTNRPKRKRSSPTLERHTPTQCRRQSDLGESKRTKIAATVSRGDKASKLGQLRASFGGNMGYDHKRRPEVRRENGVLLSWVGNEWKPAGYHIDFRENLILMDAQQPGAPVWRSPMSLNYTSYSPEIQGWTEDPRSIRDSKGRQVCLMQRPPADFKHGRKCDKYLMCSGLVMLNDNNRPVKDYPGAPLTLSNDAPSYMLEGLRRCYGMTVFDLMDRMILPRNTPSGEKSFSPSKFTNSISAWIERENEGGKVMVPWHLRRPRKPKVPENNVNPPSPLQDEEADMTDFPSDMDSAPSLDIAETTQSHVGHPWSSMPGTLAATTTCTGFGQYQTQNVNPYLYQPELHQLQTQIGTRPYRANPTPIAS